jgi:hypothetical protein
MADLRDLLIDIRIELRKLMPGFDKHKLRPRIDEAVSTLGRLPDASLIAITTSANAARFAASVTDASNPGNDQVARAWQAAAAELKATAPAFYEAMRRTVEARLAAAPVAATTPAATAASAPPAAAAPSAAIADKPTPTPAAAPIVAVEPPPSAPVAAAPAPEPPPAAAPVDTDADSHIPTRDTLHAVASGARRLTDAQREWCVGEAMVLSEFRISPANLLAQGDGEIARIILAGMSA